MGQDRLDMARLALGAVRRLADVVLPPRCGLCGGIVADAGTLCASCWALLAPIGEPACPVLGVPFAYDGGAGTVSPAALADPPDWDGARAAVAFDEPARRLIHALKYHDRHEVALVMARMMVHAAAALVAAADVVMPVPLHRRRLWSRRYNQSAILAARVAALGGRPCRRGGLVRTKPTPSQVGLDGSARRRNVAGAFRIADEALADVAGRRVLLVDDVLTTGATANACARALKAAGAARVDVCVFALVVNRGSGHI